MECPERNDIGGTEVGENQSKTHLEEKVLIDYTIIWISIYLDLYNIYINRDLDTAQWTWILTHKLKWHQRESFGKALGVRYLAACGWTTPFGNNPRCIGVSTVTHDSQHPSRSAFQLQSSWHLFWFSTFWVICNGSQSVLAAPEEIIEWENPSVVSCVFVCFSKIRAQSADCGVVRRSNDIALNSYSI